MMELGFRPEQVIGKIEINFDDYEKDITERVSPYENVVFTEDAKVEAKKLVVALRKDKKNIAAMFKEVKDIYMMPLNQFKEKVDQLTEKVDKPINQINAQVEAFESKRIMERNEDIQKIYEEKIGDLSDFLPLHRIKDEKWTNSGKTVKAIGQEMETIISNARAGKMAIESMTSDAVPEALAKFRSTLNLPDALNYINAYEASRAEILKREEEKRRQEEERRRIAEEERIRANERARVVEEERIRQETAVSTMEKVKAIDEESAAPLAVPESHRAVYTVVGTDEELVELEMAMNSLGLYFERKDI